jgi:glycosyltransferase involved in cell wall biosynthesis
MISIVCPVYNEEKYLPQLLAFLDSAEPSEKQIIFIDGGSTDHSRKLINSFKWKNNACQLLINTNRTVPYALNMAIPLCNHEIIVRLDAHSRYAENYFMQILKVFSETDADIVGGPTRTAFLNTFQEAVAYMFITPLGMGNSSVHNINYEGYTDSVTFGAWKRSIFEKTDLFDVTLKRNQDDEFHYRARSLGFKIYQHPKIELYYYPRDTWKGLWMQYFEYGYYKPDVLRKVSSEIKLRHLVPAAFVLYLFSLPISGYVGIVWLIPLTAYLIAIFFFSLFSSISFSARLFCLLAYPTVHIAYGTGFILGIFKRK